MANYIHNSETSVTLYNEFGIWGPVFADSGGFIYPWAEATQEEIDAFLLVQSKSEKIEELKDALSNFEQIGFVYENNLYCLKESGINNVVSVVSELSPANPNAYTFRDINGDVHDFETSEAWNAFKLAIVTERNRIMVYYIGKKVEIEACNTVAQVESVIIDFSS